MRRADRLRTGSLVAAFLIASLPVEGQPAQGFDGAASLFSLAEVTVVYPAGGRDEALHRRSAERRAAYLSSEHDVRTSVAPDDGVTEAQRKGHLLLLGWSNRLLQVEGNPVAQTPTGRRFLGEIELRPDDDLIFFSASPYNPDRNLYFWSRIDPELDRFLVLPFVGSDWAIYEGYLDVHHGRIQLAEGWPPRADPLAQSPQRQAAPDPPLRHSSPHYDLHYPGDRLDDDQAQRVLEAREGAWDQIVTRLGASPPEGYRVRLYVYDDEEQKQDECGVHDPFHSVPRRRELHMIRRLALSASPHEDVHLVAHALYGPAYSTALLEGLAVELEKPASDSELPLYANLLLGNDRLPTIAELLDEERIRLLSRQRIGYPAAGLLVAWLRSQAGAAGFAAIYGLADGNAETLAGLLGRDLTDLESDFRAWVDRRAAEGETEVAFRKEIGEAQRLRGLGDHEGDAAALRRALAIRPEHPETLYKLALAYLRGERFPEAEEVLRGLLALPPGRAEARYVVFGHYQLGRTHRLAGSVKKARRSFEKVLELPDLHDSHRLAREALTELSEEDGTR